MSRTEEKWHPRFTKSFMLLAHNSTRLCLFEFGLSIFVLSCSSSEVRQCRIQGCSALSLTNCKWCSAASFTITSHYSALIFIYVKYYLLQILRKQAAFSFAVLCIIMFCSKRLTTFLQHSEKLFQWIYVDIAAFQNFKVFLLLPHACEDFDRVFAT